MKKGFLLVLLVSAFLTSPSLSPAKELPKVAVWDLTPGDIKPAYSQDLTSILVSEISKLKKTLSGLFYYPRLFYKFDLRIVLPRKNTELARPEIVLHYFCNLVERERFGRQIRNLPQKPEKETVFPARQIFFHTV